MGGESQGEFPPHPVFGFFLLALHGVLRWSERYDGFIHDSLQRSSASEGDDGGGSALNSCQSENRDGSLP